ncbi:hypothetical protein FQA39_LY04573 [Lamprigera yunnana]|nr:hypothetical protein FQA39_LY04573 [Lamprigera yunnana]
MSAWLKSAVMDRFDVGFGGEKKKKKKKKARREARKTIRKDMEDAYDIMAEEVIEENYNMKCLRKTEGKHEVIACKAKMKEKQQAEQKL